MNKKALLFAAIFCLSVPSWGFFGGIDGAGMGPALWICQSLNPAGRFLSIGTGFSNENGKRVWTEFVLVDGAPNPATHKPGPILLEEPSAMVNPTPSGLIERFTGGDDNGFQLDIFAKAAPLGGYLSNFKSAKIGSMSLSCRRP